MIRINTILSILFLAIQFSSCGINKKEKIRTEYKETSYVELKNNNNASLEVLNQINFISKQLERREAGEFYSSLIVENIVILSGIPAKVNGLGYFGYSYELNQEIIDKWKIWYITNSKYISYSFFNGEKHIVINYPIGIQKKYLTLPL